MFFLEHENPNMIFIPIHNVISITEATLNKNVIQNARSLTKIPVHHY